MSETLFRFLLSQLESVRIRCGQCRGVAEVPIDKLSSAPSNIRCPGCGNVFVQHPGLQHGLTELLNRLGSAIELFEKAGVELEFTVPKDDAS